MHLMKTISDMRKYRRGIDKKVVFIPTMGALHEGHLELVRRGRSLAPITIVSIFVNPLQFGPNEDYDRYPRTLDADLALLDGLADCVFAPSVDEMCGDTSNEIKITSGTMGRIFEGKSRPGLFDGVLTMCAKLFNIVQPDVAIFGEKDAQQLILVKQLVKTFYFPLEILPVETIRDPDGLAKSSRNRYLSSDERTEALRIYKALIAGKSVADHGACVSEIIKSMHTVFEGAKMTRIDYIAIVDKENLREITDNDHKIEEVLVLIAAYVGLTRLIDNLKINLICITIPNKK